MNKIYKLVWSKVKNCYVVVSELAKSHTKSPKSGIMSRSLVAGVLASVLSFSVVPSVFAYVNTYYVEDPMHKNGYRYVIFDDIYDGDTGDTGYVSLAVRDSDGALGILVSSGNGQPSNATSFRFGAIPDAYVSSSGSSSGSVAINGLSANGRTITYTKTDGSTGTITTQDTDTTYSAGHGVSLSGTTFSAKAGTNVTVNSNGISVTGNGSVASGNTGLIDGGKLYTEVRPSDNGNYALLSEPMVIPVPAV